MQQNESAVEITKKGCPMTFFILSKMSYVTKVCHTPTTDDWWSFFFIFAIVSNWLIPMKKYLSWCSLVWTCEDMGHQKSAHHNGNRLSCPIMVAISLMVGYYDSCSCTNGCSPPKSTILAHFLLLGVGRWLFSWLHLPQHSVNWHKIKKLISC